MSDSLTDEERKEMRILDALSRRPWAPMTTRDRERLAYLRRRWWWERPESMRDANPEDYR